MPRYDYDFILENYAGGRGRWQIEQLSLILCSSVVTSLPFFIQLFSAYEPDHRCHVPVCEGPLEGNRVNTGQIKSSLCLKFGSFLDAIYNNMDWISVAVPPKERAEGQDLLKENSEFSSCRMYVGGQSNVTDDIIGQCSNESFTQDIGKEILMESI